MVIIGLDIAKGGTGIAIGDGDGPPRTSKVMFKGPSLGRTGNNFFTWLREVLIMEKPDLVMVEAAFVAPTDDAYRQTLMLGLSFTAQTVCAMRQISCETVAVSTWRKTFLGHGRLGGDESKRQCIQLCNTLGWPHGGDHNRAEAAGIWAHAHLNFGNRRGMHRQLSHGSFKRMAG